MTKDPDGIKIEKKITAQHIRRAEVDGTQYGKNAGAGRLIDLLMQSGAFGTARTPKALDRLMYKPEPSKLRSDLISRKKTTADRTYGYNRINNLRRGCGSFVPEEAEVFHDAFRWAFGDTLADAISPKALVTAPITATMQKVIAASTTWPEERITPAVTLTILAAIYGNADFTIKPVDPYGNRLGGNAGSRNSTLVPVSDIPVWDIGANYVLHVRGIEADRQCLVLETSFDEVMEEGGNETYLGFPVAARIAPGRNWSIRGAQEKPFEILEAPGQFLFVAITLPKEWDAQECFGLDMDLERISAVETRRIVKTIQQATISSPGMINIATYTYRVN